MPETGQQTSVLVERLSAATAGSRELDAAICIALQYGGPNSEGATDVRTDPEWEGDLIYEIGDEECCNRIPALTTSLDAALALAERVLPRWGVDLGFPCRLGEHGGRPWASVWPPNDTGLEPQRNETWGRCNPANAAALPLALCCAILKALDNGK